ncbi:outer membrane protein assembly factor BamB family protein [Aureliella helgolandensis]|uniref:Outer membrane biogenesis protein BamB n=1 Tax=Aureliella helgolandensis TaxID=2527968 RepID=A0A518G597_9BACT|nr:PQQ-binding-like beta-propeller repeat protein [Aureliella helgolandensis]QDV23729.1 outer membrane biogenesis protein BamB [Aureliella helgolandensis]
MLSPLLLILLAVVPETITTWPAFLGAGAQRDVTQSLPLEWSPTDHIAWQIGLTGYGQSSPVLWGDRVFVTSVEGPKKDTFHTLCFDLATGAELWRKSIANSSPVDSSVYVSRAAPTPLVDAERIICQFESGDCVAYTHTGEKLWSRQLGEEYGPFTPEFGLGASPCQTQTHLYVLLEQEGPSCLVALDKATGATTWEIDREPAKSWSSPAIVAVNGVPHVVVSSSGPVVGYDAQTGDTLWSFDDVAGNTATTPIDCGQGRFLIAASPGRGGENAAEAKRSNALLQITQSDGGWSIERKWIAEDATPSWASPIVHQGIAYWINRVGVIYSFDVETGEAVYTKRAKQSSWATPLAVDDRIYFFGKEGITTVVRAGREFEELAANQLWNPEDIPPTANTPADESNEERRRSAAMFSKPTLYGCAVANDRLLLRIGNRLYCVH